MIRIYAVFMNLNTGTQEPEMGGAQESITNIHLKYNVLSELQGKPN